MTTSLEPSAMSFCQTLWQANLPLYQRTLDLPFNRELAAGTLSRERFRHYMIQDAHYLVAYGRALAVAAAKADNAEGVVQFAAAANVAVVEERKLHSGFLRDYDISAEEFASTPLSPVCHHYTSFLVANSWSESYPVALAGLLPCFWIYAEVGRDILARSVPGNPYQAWVDTYAGEEFHAVVRGVIDTIDRVADAADSATRERMAEAYRYSAELEWMFWDSAYQLGAWPTR